MPAYPIVRFAVLAAAIAAPLALAACGTSQAANPAADEATAVRIAPVSVERLAPPVVATGILRPKEEIGLSFKIGGIVRLIAVNEGDLVRAGDTLATLELPEIDAGVTRARSAADKAERDLSRARRLHEDSVATLEQVQNAETALEVARAELESARFNRRFAVIVAPASGVVLRRGAETGELVPAGMPVLTLGSFARGQVVRAGLADRDAMRVRRGDFAQIQFTALDGRVLEGTVTEIAAAADPLTGTWRVEVSVPGNLRLASGLVGDLEIRPAAQRQVALVPIEAVLEAHGRRATVFAVAPDGRHAERREVTIAFLAGNRVALTAGLDGVRSVVTDGAAYLDDGDAVRVQP